MHRPATCMAESESDTQKTIGFEHPAPHTAESELDTQTDIYMIGFEHPATRLAESESDTGRYIDDWI